MQLIRKKMQRTEGIELPNHEKIETFGEKENTHVLVNIGNGYHQTSEDKRKYLKRLSQENQKVT